MKLAGSLFNRLEERQSWRMPTPGEGATELAYSDRYAYTVTRTTPSGKTFWAKEDSATRTDKNGMTDSGQAYTYKPNPDAEEVEVRWTGIGWKRRGRSTYFKIGVREKYHDFGF
jgi:hypothetical protein